MLMDTLKAEVKAEVIKCTREEVRRIIDKLGLREERQKRPLSSNTNILVKQGFFQTTKVKNRQDKKKKLAGKKSSIPVNKNEGRIRINPPNSHNKISRVQECEHIVRAIRTTASVLVNNLCHNVRLLHLKVKNGRANPPCPAP